MSTGNLTAINEAIYAIANQSYGPGRPYRDIQEAHDLIAAHGKRIAEFTTMSRPSYYEVDGDVWFVSSHTQIQWCGHKADWTLPKFAEVVEQE